MLRLLPVFMALFSTGLTAGEICPLPTQNNVSYQSVTKLQVRSPTQVISYGAEDLQFAELWLPEAPENSTLKSPVVALVHGGCWLSAYDIMHTHALSGALADSGYAVWSLEYRRTGDQGGGWPGSLDDVIQGLNFLKTMNSDLLDLNSVAVVGHSAGGHLAILAGSDHRLELQPKLILGMAPIVDIITYAKGSNSCQSATPKFLGGREAEVPDAYKFANAVLDDYKFNTRAIHGDADTIVPLSQSTQHLPTRIIEGAGHFDFVHPHTPAFRAILRELALAL